MKDQTRVIAALLIGAAAGAALGLLLAPEKGETLRGDIADYIDDLVDAAKTKAQATTGDLKEFSASIYEQAKTKITGLVNDAADYKDDAIGTAKSKIKETAEQAIGHLNEVKSKIKASSNDLNNSVQNS
jgi:gas vesicle protein